MVCEKYTDASGEDTASNFMGKNSGQYCLSRCR